MPEGRDLSPLTCEVTRGAVTPATQGGPLADRTLLHLKELPPEKSCREHLVAQTSSRTPLMRGVCGQEMTLHPCRFQILEQK